MSEEEAILEARKVEKFFTSDGHRIEVIAPTDLKISPGKIVVVYGAGLDGWPITDYLRRQQPAARTQTFLIYDFSLP